MPVPGSPFTAGRGPISVAVDPTAKFAYVANFYSNNVSAYSIGQRRPDSRPGFTLWSEGKSHFSGYHPTDAFTVASRNGKYGTLATC